MNSPALAPFGTELLDDPAADPAVVARSLANIARANWWFGGTAAALWGIDQLLRDVGSGHALTLLDVGTGAADLPAAAVRRAARRGRHLSAIGLERSPVAAALAAARGFPAVIGCAGQLPVRPGAVDIVLISQVAHHLAADAAVELFRAATALARIGVVVADLRRSELAVAAFRLGSALLGFDAVTRADGITSVRRGYHVRDLADLAARAGQQARVCRRPGFRVVAYWRSR
ncbi:MAG TPA: methyltransferase domain-containing protein [Gemmatimonadales bacterium]|nr:methyltransferase domain-containing protein [Gemmatimonadales bacterium]HRZ08358.1 methyltransferase domain-containing protein [Gemmatimonadales bacterium]